MQAFTNLNEKQEMLNSITTLEKELSEKTGKEVVIVAYSPIKYAALSDDAEAIAKISELEQYLTQKSGKDIALVAFSI